MNAVDGLIFWNVDNDKLAAEVGRHLEKQSPEGIKIIEYTGEKEFPGLYRKTEKYIYVEDAVNSILKEHGRDYLQRLRDMDGAYAKRIFDWEKNLIKEHNAKFSIELHDTPTKRGWYCKRKDWIDVEFSTISFNKKMYQFLEDYCKTMRPTLADKYNLEYFYANSTLMYSTPYHQVVVEIHHDPLKVNKPRAVEDASNVLIELSGYLQKEYPLLWQKYL